MAQDNRDADNEHLERQHLLVDADDTLWENNIYFEAAIEEFIEFLQHSKLSPQEVRFVLEENERAQGYGSASFARSLRETYRHLAEREVREADIQQVMSLGTRIIEHPLQLMEGVRETLEYLAPRHDLILVTKGSEDEQRFKIENSGLDDFFMDAIVVPEKHRGVYAEIVKDFHLEPSRTWMVGNSPKSDINPAREAGIHAVFIPHPYTWSLEKQAIQREGASRLLELQRFADLCTYF